MKNPEKYARQNAEEINQIINEIGFTRVNVNSVRKVAGLTEANDQFISIVLVIQELRAMNANLKRITEQMEEKPGNSTIE